METLDSPSYDTTLADDRAIGAVVSLALPLSLPIELQRVIIDINSYGYRVLIVGGLIRDILITLLTGMEVSGSKDCDLEVYGCPIDELEQILQRHGHVGLVGKSYGILKFTDHTGTTYDFGVPRCDNKTGVGHKEFQLTFGLNISPKEAASRRDFTCNAIAYDPITEELHDYYSGRKHLKERLLVAVGQAFTEDPLRVLRGMQFSARFNMELDPETAQRCAEMGGEYHSISIERIAEEWCKYATRSVRPSSIFPYLMQTGWIKFYPELEKMVGVPQEESWHPEGSVDIHTGHVLDAAANICLRENVTGDDRIVLIMAALCHDMAKPATTEVKEIRGTPRITSHGHEKAGGPIAADFLRRIGMRADIIKRVIPLVENHLAHANFYEGASVHPRVVRKLASRLYPATVRELAYLIEADASGRPPLPPGLPEAAQRMLAMALSQHVMEAPQDRIILGRHLLERGLQPGPTYTTWVNSAYAHQLAGSFSTVEEAAVWLDARLAEGKEAPSPPLEELNDEIDTAN